MGRVTLDPLAAQPDFEPAPRPRTAPPRLLTVAEYLELGETELGYDELVEGRVVMTPGPEPDHDSVGVEALIQLRQQVPAQLDLELAPPVHPGPRAGPTC